MKEMYIWDKKDTVNWINNHELFNKSKKDKEINNIFKYVMKKKDNLKFKEGFRNEEFMYWYPSLNSLIPLTSKADRVHQSIYVFHDIVHFSLLDPLPNVKRNTYIKMKILGEIFSFYISEFKYVQQLQKELKWHWDLKYTDLKFNTKCEKKILKALYYNFVLNDKTKLNKIVKNKNYLKLFNDAYCTMFSKDIEWNDKIYTQLQKYELNINWKNKIEYNSKYISNEHFYCDKDYNDKEIFNLCYKHYKKIIKGKIKPKGNGFKLGEKLGQFKTNNYNMVFNNIKVNYRD